MKNLNAKQKQNLLENASPVEYILQTGMADSTLTESLFEFMRPFQWLHNKAQNLRSFDGKYVFYRDAKGQRKSVTQYQFIIQGLPKIQAGLKQILNIKDSEERLTAIIRFEAIVRLTCGINATKYHELTENMVAEQVETTRRLAPAYDETVWGTELKSIFGTEAMTVEASANRY